MANARLTVQDGGSHAQPCSGASIGSRLLPVSLSYRRDDNKLPPRGKQCRRGLGTGPVSMLLGQDWALSPGQLARTGPGLGLSAWGAGQTPVGLSPQSPSENLLQPLKSSVLGDSGEKNRPSARHFLEIFRGNGSNTRWQPQCEWWRKENPSLNSRRPHHRRFWPILRPLLVTWPRTGH